MKYGCGLLRNGTTGAVMVGLVCGLYVCSGQCDKVEVIELSNWTITNQNGCEYHKFRAAQKPFAK